MNFKLDFGSVKFSKDAQKRMSMVLQQAALKEIASIHSRGEIKIPSGAHTILGGKRGGTFLKIPNFLSDAIRDKNFGHLNNNIITR